MRPKARVPILVIRIIPSTPLILLMGDVTISVNSSDFNVEWKHFFFNRILYCTQLGNVERAISVATQKRQIR